MTFRSQLEPSIKSYECFMFLYNFRLEKHNGLMNSWKAIKLTISRGIKGGGADFGLHSLNIFLVLLKKLTELKCAFHTMSFK